MFSDLKIFKLLFIKNVSTLYLIKNSGTTGLREFSFFLSSTFVYEPILIEISINTNNK